MTVDKLWSIPVRVDDIPADGTHFSLEADAAARAAIARAAELVGLPRLTAEFDVAWQGREAVHVAGAVSADIQQTCVVTLDPLENTIEERVDLMFAPAPDAAATMAAETPDDAQDASEPLVDGTIDLGALAVESLLLAIDRYPRKAGAAFVPPVNDDGEAHPFAALAAFKKPDRGDK
jgi:uncharacterized metal-binding protein YceD (DUF177 family)